MSGENLRRGKKAGEGGLCCRKTKPTNPKRSVPKQKADPSQYPVTGKCLQGKSTPGELRDAPRENSDSPAVCGPATSAERKLFRSPVSLISAAE